MNTQSSLKFLLVINNYFTIKVRVLSSLNDPSCQLSHSFLVEESGYVTQDGQHSLSLLLLLLF